MVTRYANIKNEMFAVVCHIVCYKVEHKLSGGALGNDHLYWLFEAIKATISDHVENIQLWNRNPDYRLRE